MYNLEILHRGLGDSAMEIEHIGLGLCTKRKQKNCHIYKQLQEDGQTFLVLNLRLYLLW